MKRFVSRLKPLLRLRQQQEKLAALQLAEAARQADLARLQLQRKQALQQQATAAIGTLLREEPTGGTLRSGQQNSQWHRQRVVEQTEQTQVVENAFARAGQLRTAAWKDLKVAEEATQRERAQYELQQRQQQLADIVDRASHHYGTVTTQNATSHTTDTRPLCDSDPLRSDSTSESES
ncbi:MAG: hypothetical protein NXI04_07325 [Planctomycetaceae bacterium]|nr:hypothetical protein [Planctomycetaceae bacterium]